MRRSAIRLVLAALLPFGVVGLAVSQPVPVPPQKAGGKAEETGPKPEGYQSFTFPVERDASQRLEAVIDYMKKKSVPWDIVCSAAQQLLDARSDSFYPVRDPETGKETGTRVSVKAKINDVIGELPREGRQFYELTYGPIADAALKEAVQNGYDRVALADISQRYFHTRAGAQATLLLAGVDLEIGNYPEAAYGFQRLLARPETDEFLTPRVLFKAAVAFKRSGDVRQAESVAKLMDRLEKKFPRDGLVIGTRTYSFDDLKQQLDRPAELLGRVGDELVTQRMGNASHTAIANGGTPFLDPSFVVPMLFRTDGQEKEGKDWVDQNLQTAMKHIDRGKSQVAIPGFFPVTSPNLILYRTYDGVYAVVTKEGYVAHGRTYKAGELFWMSPARSGLQTLMSSPDEQQTIKNWWGQFWSRWMPSILFENAQVGSLSHDGKLVYFVDDLAIPPFPQVYNPNMGMPNPVGMPSTNGAGVHGKTEYNRLVALNIDTGKVEWELGGLATSVLSDEEEQKSNDTRILTENAYFLGPPLPVNGKIYVLYERNSQIRLACLDPNKLVPAAPGPNRKPELVWSQNLGAPNTRLNQDSNRRVQPSYLAYADGVMVCPTNCGAVIAVDVNARSLLWARYYGSTHETGPMLGEAGGPGGRGGGFRRGGVMPIQQNGGTLPSDRWRAATPIIAQGKVLFTAHDSDHIQCLDLRTGNILWSDERKKDDLFVGGVIDGKALVVGKTAVRAYALAGEKGKPKLAWPNQLPIGNPSGTGVASRDGLYYLPVVGNPEQKDSTEPQVYAIDVNAGQIRSKTSFRRKAGDAGEGGDPRLALGNLVFHDGMLFSQTPVEISAFPLIELKKREMARRLKENPNDPVGLAERGVLSLDNGDIREAIADFKESQKHDPPESVRRMIREKLYVAYTELLRSKFADGEAFLKEYESLCEVLIDPDADPSAKTRAIDEQLRRRGLYLTLVAKGREKQGRLVEAFDAYRAFASLGDNKQLVDIYDEPNGKTRPDVWARGRIDAMIRHAKDPATRKPLEARVQRDWDTLKAGNDLPGLKEFVKVFGPYFSVGRDAQLLLADKLLQTNSDEDTREAQTQLMQLWATSEDPAYAARAVESLARLMIRRGMLEDAVGLYSQLGSKYAIVTVRDGKTGADIYGELITDKRLLPYLEPGSAAPTGKYKVDAQNVQNTRVPFQSFTIHPDGELLPFLRRLQITMQMSPNGDGTWSLVVSDRTTGEERCKFPGLSGVQNISAMGFQQGAPSYRMAQASGHLLMVNAGQWAYCFDLAEKRELWRYNLLGNAALPSNNPPRVERDEKDGDILFHYEDGWTLRLGRSSILQPTFACLVTRDGLVALDPSTGEKLWVRTNVSSKVQVFGDARHIFLIDGSDSKVMRAVDGTIVDGIKEFASVFTSTNRVEVIGRQALLSEGGSSKGRTLRLYDPLTGEDVWKKEFPAAGTILLKTLDPETTGALSPDGKFEVLETRTGKSLYKGAIDPDRVNEHMKNASGTMVVTNPLLLSDTDRYYLFLNRPSEPGRGPIPYGYTMIRSQDVNGPLYAFDKASGKRLWYHEVFKNQKILLDRFDEMPCIVAAAQVADEKSGQQQYRVVVLDKQLGLLRYNKPHDQNGFFMTVGYDPKTRVYEYYRYNLRLRIVPEDSEAANR